jgi:thioredoxin reductase (NADPH)
VIIATGARYNRLPLDRLSELEGVGVYYAASQMEAQACVDKAVVVVGGGNSVGQAALSSPARVSKYISSSAGNRSPVPCRAT